MADIEQRVRDAAKALQDAIVEARKAGYRVHLPHQVEDLHAIPVSATAKAVPAGVPDKAADGRATTPMPAVKPIEDVADHSDI